MDADQLTIFNKTRVNRPKWQLALADDAKVLCLGSCFANNLGDFLKASLYNVTSNPLGISYHPLSLRQHILFAKEIESIPMASYVETEACVYNYHFHSDLWAENQGDLRAKLEAQIQAFRSTLKDADVIVFTLGSAHYFRHLDKGIRVANCHKQPANLFEKFRSSLTEIEQILRDICEEVIAINSQTKIIFTVSPIRHVRYGLEENTLGKATLLLAIDQVVNSFEEVYYLPVYETVMDELRDYQYYQPDGIHLRREVVQHICEHYVENIFSKEGLEYFSKIKKLVRAASHRPFQPQSPSHLKFLNQQSRILEEVMDQYPNHDYSSLKTAFHMT